MYSSIQIANYFVKKAKEDEVSITNMKLQKLVYISHGFHLAFFDEPLVVEKVQAWDYGPVIPEIYHGFKEYGSGPIEGYCSQWFRPDIVDDNSISQFLNAIWASYGSLGAVDLSALTHQEDSPWSQVYQPGVKGSVISNDIIKKHYALKVKNIREGVGRG